MRFEKEINLYAENAILKRFKTNETNVEVVQGKISALISESELIELQNSSATMFSKLASAALDIGSLKLDFSDLTTKYNTVSGQYTDLSSKVAQYKASVDGLSVNLTSVTKNLQENYSTTTAMNAAIKAMVDEYSVTVSNTYATQAALTSEAGKITDLQTWKNEASQKITADAIVSTVRSSTDYSNDLSGKVGTNEVISCINQTSESIKISANKLALTAKGIVDIINGGTTTIKASLLKLEGYTTINNGFSIDTAGNAKILSGVIAGWSIKSDAIRSNSDQMILYNTGKIVSGTGGNALTIENGVISNATFSDITIFNDIASLNGGASIKGTAYIYADTYFYGTNKMFNLTHVSSGGHLVFGSDGATLAYLSSSSKRYKDHICSMDSEEAEKIYNIPVVWFQYKDGYLDPDDRCVGRPIPGFYAEDVAEIMPIVARYVDGIPEDWNERMLMPYIVKAMQAMKVQMDNMQLELNMLKICQ